MTAASWEDVAALRRRIEDKVRQDLAWLQKSGTVDEVEAEVALTSVLAAWNGELSDLDIEF